MRALLLSLILLAACDPAAPEPEPEAEPEAEVEVEAEPEPEPEIELGASDVSWRWYHRPPERDTGGLSAEALHDHTLLHEVGRPRRFEVRRDGGALEVFREDRSPFDPPTDRAWTRRYDVGATGQPVIGVTYERLLAAAPTATGYVVLSIDETDGSERWRRVITRDGPAPVQLSSTQPEPAIVVFGHGDPPWVHELDDEGRLTARATFGPEVHRAFEPPAARDLHGYRVRHRGETLTLLGPGGLAVTLRDDDPFGGALGAAVPFDDLVVAVVFHGGSSGAAAYGVDPAAGEVRWTSSPGSIGSIGHSRYSNDVRAVRDGEHVVVYGDESAGRYVGVIDPVRGRLVGCEVWRM